MRRLLEFFQRGITLCQTQGTNQIGMLTSMPWFTKSDIISYEQ